MASLSPSSPPTSVALPFEEEGNTPPTPTIAVPDQPHLLSLVLQSKKALQHGEQLCSRANAMSDASAQGAVDILALDAKVRWITDAVLEQLKLAANVAKSIEDKRAQLDRRIHEWDTLRTKHNDALDEVLDKLGAQYVPPEFYQTSSDSSIFGSQHSQEDDSEHQQHKGNENGDVTAPSSPLISNHVGSSPRSPTSNQNHIPRSPIITTSPAATIRSASRTATRKHAKPEDRRNWKTLRDFVDDRAIENALENMDNDRATFDDIRAPTSDYSSTLLKSIDAIRNSLPPSTPLPSIKDVLDSQDVEIHKMVVHLTSLGSHYDQMETALKDHEDGEEIGQEDFQEMTRDTDELPKIMSELEESVKSVESAQEEIMSAKRSLEEQLQRHPVILNDLDLLAEIMDEMLETQQVVETECIEHLHALHAHLTTLENLHGNFISYRTSFSKLLLEIARRRLYQEAAEKIVDRMMAQLNDMTREEKEVREHFNAEHGVHLPEDLCLCIGDSPTKWEVVPQDSVIMEVPHIDDDLLTEARENLSASETALQAESI